MSEQDEFKPIRVGDSVILVSPTGTIDGEGTVVQELNRPKFMDAIAGKGRVFRVYWEQHESECEVWECDIQTTRYA
tara:strand:- start:8867 stop:9094 length:228 start_codon:yes stop_codon:yes gene_type:complete